MAANPNNLIALGMPAALANAVAKEIDAAAVAAVDALQFEVTLTGTANGTATSTGTDNPRAVSITTTAP